MERMQHPPAASAEHVPHELVIELHGIRVTLTRSVRLFAEAAIVPGLIFVGVLHLAGLDWAVGATLGWMYLVLGLRRWRQGSCPGTLVLAAGMFHGRAAVALATASAAVYLLQPIAGSVVMAALFLGSACIGRPVTIRLARDFVHVPAHVLERARVQRMFTQVALVWGLSRVIDAAVTVVMFTSSTQAGLMSRSLFSPALTVLTIGACTALGVRALRRDGVTFRHVPVPAVVRAVA
jgi:hypothetical protein